MLQCILLNGFEVLFHAIVKSFHKNYPNVVFTYRLPKHSNELEADTHSNTLSLLLHF
jgi:hypothetical protein